MVKCALPYMKLTVGLLSNSVSYDTTFLQIIVLFDILHMCSNDIELSNYHNCQIILV